MTDSDVARLRELAGEALRLEAAATPGPWDLLDSRVEPWHFTAPNGDKPGDGCVEWQILGGAPAGRSTDYGWAVLHGEAGPGQTHPERADLLLAVAARNALPDLARLALAALGERDRVVAAYHKSAHAVEQVLGKALGCPVYDGDQVDPAGAGTVCVGDHTPVTLADAAARRIADLEAERERMKAALRPFAEGHHYADEELRHLADRDACPLNPYDEGRSPTVGDCRKAREVLGDG